MKKNGWVYIVIIFPKDLFIFTCILPYPQYPVSIYTRTRATKMCVHAEHEIPQHKDGFTCTVGLASQHGSNDSLDFMTLTETKR